MSDVKTQLSLQQRELSLFRYPKRSNELLQAWDAGDEYLINHIETLALEDNQHILILNDSFGALSSWFSLKHRVTMVSDSYIARQATSNNLQQNSCNPITQLSSLDAIPEDVDLVLMQIPKNNRYLNWQLACLAEKLTPTCPVVAVNKAKEIHSSTLKIFEQRLGNTTTSLAKKKHRLVFITPSEEPKEPLLPVTEWPVEGENFCLKNYPNTYSGEKLDLGARFMLQHLPKDESLQTIIDLGCGNGVLSVKLAQLNPQASITAVDESDMAAASAQLNLEQTLGAEHSFQVVINNCLEGFDPQSTDLVVCNPPFHQSNTITDHIAWQMFCDAKHVLRYGGRLMVIGNRHLGYDIKLSRLFGRSQVKQVATNNKFVILQATK